MSEKSINLCGLSGREAVDALTAKVVDPLTPLSVGRNAVARVLHVHHIGDGLPVITVLTTTHELIILQFTPSDTSFAVTAMGQDGQTICTPYNDSLD